jgi:hypothetical protein
VCSGDRRRSWSCPTIVEQERWEGSAKEEREERNKGENHAVPSYAAKLFVLASNTFVLRLGHGLGTVTEE